MYTLCMSSINLTENGNCRYVILLEEKHIGSIMLFLHVSICISTKLQNFFFSFGWTGIVDICIFSPYIEDLEPRLFNHNMPKIQCIAPQSAPVNQLKPHRCLLRYAATIIHCSAISLLCSLRFAGGENGARPTTHFSC